MKAVAHRTARYQQVLSGAIQYLLRDDFTDTRAAGAVNGTPATPGPGTRTVVDTESKLSISSGKLSISGGKTSAASGDPGYWLDAQTRDVGKLFLCELNASSLGLVRVGWAGAQSGAPSQNAVAFNGPNLQSFDNSVAVNHAATATGTQYFIAIGLRATGAFHLVKTTAGNWLLLWLSGAGNAATVYPAISNFNAALTSDLIRVPPTDLWLPPPLASDGFGSSFGTTDGLGHAEGIAGGIGAGGGGLAWTQQIGTWTVSGAKAAAATLSGGYAAATVPCSTANVLAECKVTRSAGQGGLILRWTDSSNYLYAEHDGTNAYLKQVLAGVTTTLITAAATYSANARLIVDLNETAGRLYWNNALVGTTSSINAGLTATAHGIRSTDTGGIQLDDFVVYAKGSGGEYSILNQYTT